ncbi:MAG: aminoacetone oxidase family FAD-binding enzyme [Lachnospiraceae bacterium]|nr:aminoacetone oxidase family FAD-binding enzyme [Lachnospiraceae bacterium]
MKYNTIIVGAGAAGLMAACELSFHTDSVLVIDRMDAPGKKILATGNGKCNMTNLYMERNCFRGTGGDLAFQTSRIMTPEAVREYFFRLGLLTMERNGYVYPITEQAKTVLKTLLFHLEKKNIPIRLGERVLSVKPDKNKGFTIETDSSVYKAEHVILACGGKASPNLGSDGSGYDLLKQLKIKMNKPLPALTGLCSSKKMFKSLSGVRTKGCISYFGKDGHYTKETGEIQLAAYGISGIPVFQISRYVIEDLEKERERMAGKEKEKNISVEVLFDFFPDMTFQDLKAAFYCLRKIEGATCADVLGGVVHEKWVPVLLGESGISPKDAPDTVPEKKWNKLIQFLKQYPIPINGYRGFEFAQACQGGAMESELTKQMESVKYPGLYVTGELVDVDGTCGGYNLHWAFTSGYVAAKNIVSKSCEK